MPSLMLMVSVFPRLNIRFEEVHGICIDPSLAKVPYDSKIWSQNVPANMDVYDVLIQTEPGGGWRREQPTWRLCGSTADTD